jgi:hypothetical protein
MSEVELSHIEAGHKDYQQIPQNLSNAGYEYYKREEKLHGFLSQQFPTIANPAPLGLCGFALTTFVLSLHNSGGLVCKFLMQYMNSGCQYV